MATYPEEEKTSTPGFGTIGLLSPSLWVLLSEDVRGKKKGKKKTKVKNQVKTVQA
ncbi:hypothetical protein [Methanosarcina horonobensis]|uniref:hypothetical protein n=1 Tax=Methanosarcina horonobensis TaxID=418008 RepID=UPI000A3EBD58|nr:hypothetical protein [Methanosarcina horonobensis]